MVAVFAHSPIRVLHVLPYWTCGGVETFIVNLVAHSRHRHCVCASHRLPIASRSLDEIPVLLADRDAGIVFPDDFDVVHYHHLQECEFVRDHTWEWILEKPSVFTVHNIYTRGSVDIPSVTVVASSPPARDAYTHHVRGPEVDRVILPGVDEKRFAPGMGYADKLFPHTNLPVAAWVGRICPGKGADMLVDIIEAGRGRWNFLIVGDDYFAGGLQNAPSFIRDVLCSDMPHVRRYPVVHMRRMPLVYNTATVVFSTSEREGFGLTIAEAMACERPVVVPDVPALNWLVDDSCGVVVKSLIAERFIEAMDEVAARRFVYGSNGRRRILELGATARQCAAEYDALYERLV